MEKEQKDAILLGLIESGRYPAEVNSKGKKRRRQSFSYSFAGEEVCAGAFRYVYDVGTKHLVFLAHGKL